jgi:hypothetical protein
MTQPVPVDPARVEEPPDIARGNDQREGIEDVIDTGSFEQ